LYPIYAVPLRVEELAERHAENYTDIIITAVTRLNATRNAGRETNRNVRVNVRSTLKIRDFVCAILGTNTQAAVEQAK
jgi:hypothetical protein